jgi:CubicO group peptidase (beta-lactamase class C family)
MTSKEFADQYLFGPLGIKNYVWFHDSDYNYVGGHTIFLRPRDLAKVGQMILDENAYEVRQIVSKQWLEKSFNPAVNEFAKTDDGETTFEYGYLWWLGEYQGYQYQFGWGFGGQFLFLIPEVNTLVVTTAYPDPTGHTHWERYQKIIKEVMHTVIEALPEKKEH